MKKVTQTEFGAWTGLTQPEVSKYVKAGVIDLSEGLQESIVRYCRHVRKTASGRQGTAGIHDLADERARLAHHQANNEAMKEAERRGELIPAEEVAQHWGEMLTNLRARLLALPTKLAPKVMQADSMREVEAFAKKEIHAALNELADDKD